MTSLKVNLLKNNYSVKIADCKVGNSLRHRFADSKQLNTAGRGLRIEDMNANVGGALITKKNAYVFNVAPERQCLSQLKTIIEKKADELLQDGNKLLGFICGGWNIDKNNDISKRSFDIYNTLADKFEDLKIPFGMICGKEIGNHFDNFRVKENNIYMWSDLISKRFPDEEIVSREKILENLEKDYGFVEISPEIQLVSPKKPVEHETDAQFTMLG